jgi:hypothetical protein
MHLQRTHPSIRIVQWSPATDYSLLPSISRSGMTFEVGPVPCGCLAADLYALTRTLVLETLDFVERHNDLVTRPLRAPASHVPPRASADGDERDTACSLQPASKHARINDSFTHISTTVFSRVCSIDYPRDSLGNLCGMIHPDLQGKDFEELKEASPLFMGLDCSTVSRPRAPHMTHTPRNPPPPPPHHTPPRRTSRARGTAGTAVKWAPPTPCL